MPFYEDPDVYTPAPASTASTSVGKSSDTDDTDKRGGTSSRRGAGSKVGKGETAGDKRTPRMGTRPDPFSIFFRRKKTTGDDDTGGDGGDTTTPVDPMVDFIKRLQYGAFSQRVGGIAGFDWRTGRRL